MIGRIPGLIRKSIIIGILINWFSVLSFAGSNFGKITAITELNGLSSNNINSVLVDRMGYVWVGTYNGLTRYDGYDFKKFYSNPNDPTSMKSLGLIMYAMMEDSRNNIWIGSNPSFIEKYDPVSRTFQSFDYSSKLDLTNNEPVLYGYAVSAIVEDSNGRIYFGITTATGQDLKYGLLYKEVNSDTLQLFKNPGNQSMRDVYGMKKDNKGNIWINSTSGIFIIDDLGLARRFTPKNFDFLENGEFFADAFFTPDNHLWILTTHLRLVEYDTASDSFNQWTSPYSWMKNGSRVSGSVMYLDDEQKIWIGTSNGVQFFDLSSRQFSRLNKELEQELENAYISVFAPGDFGDIWIGTYNKGLIHYENQPRFTSYTPDSAEGHQLTIGWASVLFEASDGKIWIITDNGYNLLDTLTETTRSISYDNLPEDIRYTSAVWEVGKDEMHVASIKKLNSYSPGTNTIKPVSLPGIPADANITKHYTDRRGNEWISTHAGLYKRGKEATQFVKYDLEKLPGNDFTSNDITGLFESDKHGLWILTNNGLFLYHYDTDKIDRHGADHTKNQVFITQDINSFYEDRNGIAWVGLWQGGLSRYNPETGEIKNYTVDDGLPSMGVQAIMGDEKNGKLWISTFNGLSRFDTATEQFNNFSADDGLQGPLFADGSFLKTSTGKFIFGGANGISIFDPNDFNIKYEPPRVFLTDLMLFNKLILPGEKSILKKALSETRSITLKYNQNNITISYNGIHYSNPLKNRFSYILENHDEQWREVGTQREAFYPILAPGKYTFKVKAANNQGIWSDITSLDIIINPPWYATWLAYVIYGLLLIPIAFATDKYTSNRAIRHEREKAQEKELEHAHEIEKAYKDLKDTQAQLIQSEKMASLGELTAGIAHEIQNPLNFVNNFSDLNSELIDEAKEELDHGNPSEVKSILDDIKENEGKINQHGKRAESIVKGMLLHSRSSGGQKELTDINALADEYLRLSYHGFRAKDKSFNADFELEADESLPKVNVVPQDIGRVLLNLINNAFYAVSEKSKLHASSYKPQVIVRTKSQGNKIGLSVKDNGNGIPDSVKDKIFQPFFTTKPTGQGTGLGLSLSYDIVKAHGGELAVETEEGSGTTFTVILPETKS